ERVGGTSSISVDVRIISATNHSLNDLVRKGEFRKDLLFRLNAFPIFIPPLKERLEDIPPLVENFITQYNFDAGTEIKGITPEALKILSSYYWPGNVRELYSVMERACIDVRGDYIEPKNLLRFTDDYSLYTDDVVNLNEVRDRAEKAAIIKVLQLTNDNKSEAAKKLGISRSTLYTKLKEYDI
ncbi:MAG TPA: sigma 54-interacting transcriptional regulator, partial [Syntrophomonadaceae bacterium]|nr:sigma 54-interacting transcriptional regulator [Syntrophomonadaceae bacterium]